MDSDYNSDYNSDSESITITKRLISGTDTNYDSCSEVLVPSSDSVIHITPEKEAAAQRKFDKYLVPVCLVFIILSSLDRNNVSRVSLL